MTTDDRTPGSFSRSSRPRRTLAGMAALTLLVAACSLETTNPSGVPEEELVLKDSADWGLRVFPVLVRGGINDALIVTSGGVGNGGLYMAGALLTDELVHSGTRPGLRRFSQGDPAYDLDEVDALWSGATRARVVAENAVEKMKASAAFDSTNTNEGANWYALGYVWAGLTNRLMGDNFCSAVFNIGPLQSSNEYYKRAEQYFTNAIRLGELQGYATGINVGYGGRAQVRMMLGDWDGAVADAAMVLTTYTYTGHLLHSATIDVEKNYFVVLGRDQGETTVWGTPFETLGRPASTSTVGDPRARFDPSTTAPNGTDGRRPWLREAKFTIPSNAIVPVRGTEMRLIEAEAALTKGDLVGAVSKINEVRAYRNTAAGGNMQRPLVTAATVDAGWDVLQRERGLEFWLEGRRLPDMRRWARKPGFVRSTVVRRVGTGAAATDERRNVLADTTKLCIPVSKRERLLNPNIPDALPSVFSIAPS